MRTTAAHVRFSTLLAMLAAAVLVIGAATARAYFTTSGRTTASASVGTLTPPGSPTARLNGSSVQVAWNAARLSSGGSVQGYRVIRSDSVAVCGSPTPVSGLSCTDSAPSLGSTYTYTVTAVYATFSASATTATITVLIAPTISSKPSNPSASTAPSFSFSGGGGTGYNCRLDTGSWQACTSGVSYSALLNGSHTFAVHATSGAASGPDASYTWTVDTTAPSITSSPPNPSANTTATFTYQHPQAAYTFQCKLDAAAWSSCSTVGTSFSSLTDASHTVQVRALSADGASTAAASYAWMIDTAAPSITAHPSNPSTSTFASFSFTQAESAYTFSCQIDGGSWSSCASSKTYTLGDGSHTFAVRAIDSASFATATASFTWLIDTTAPTDVVTLASGASGAYLSGATLYYKSNASGSFQLTDTVTDSGSGPASATFPAIATTGWAHNAQTVTGAGPYTSSTFTWNANPSNPATYTITSKDAAGNQSTGKTISSFVADITGPTGGAITVNGTAATSGGTTSATTSTSFTISNRVDYTDTGSGIASSTLTVQSTTLTSNVCGAPGSGGPFMSQVAISGTTQPNGITAGYCYIYTLTGTDKVTNISAISTTVKVTTAPSVGAVVFVPSMSGVNVTVSGSGFVSGTTFSDSDPDVTVNSTTFVSSTLLTVNVTTTSNPGTGNITVTNPDASTGTCANCSYLIAQVSSGNGTSANSISTSPSFTLSAGVTYILLAADQFTSTGNTATPSAPGGWQTAPTFTPIGGIHDSYNNDTAHDWAWLVTGGAGSGTFQVTFSNQMSYGYVGVLAFPGTVRLSNVGYGESGCSNNVSTCSSTTQTDPATAQLFGGAPLTGAAQLILWSDKQYATPTVASPFTGMYFNVASQSSASGSTRIYAGPATTSVVSLNQGLNTNWGTLTLEIDP